MEVVGGVILCRVNACCYYFCYYFTNYATSSDVDCSDDKNNENNIVAVNGEALCFEFSTSE